MPPTRQEQLISIAKDFEKNKIITDHQQALIAQQQALIARQQEHIDSMQRKLGILMIESDVKNQTSQTLFGSQESRSQEKKGFRERTPSRMSLINSEVNGGPNQVKYYAFNFL